MTSVVTLRQDVAPAAERRRSRAAGVHDGRDAGVDTAEVRIDAGAVDALEDVGVQVDEPRCDELAADLDHPRGVRGRDARRHLRNRRRCRPPRRAPRRTRSTGPRLFRPSARDRTCLASERDARDDARIGDTTGRAAIIPGRPCRDEPEPCDDALAMSKPAGRIHEMEHHAADWATTRPVVVGHPGRHRRRSSARVDGGHAHAAGRRQRVRCGGGRRLRRRGRGADRVLHAVRRVRGARLRCAPRRDASAQRAGHGAGAWRRSRPSAAASSIASPPDRAPTRICRSRFPARWTRT